MEIVLLEPDTPEWLFWFALIAGLGSVLVMLIWSAILEIKYIGPYTLIATPPREKWRRAFILALLQTGMIPVLGLVQPPLSPHPDQWPAFPLFCAGLWMVILPVATLFKRWEFESHLKRYKRLDGYIKSGVLGRIFSFPFVKWFRIFLPKEARRFFEEGYPEEQTKI